MKKNNYFLVAIFAFSPLLPVSAQELETPIDSISYILGTAVGGEMKQSLLSLPGEPLDTDLFIKGISDMMKNEPFLINDPINALYVAERYYAKLEQENLTKKETENEANKLAGETFLMENKKRSDVVTTNSGLQYRVLVAGKGKKPKLTDEVKVHYRGMLIDGTEFDNSFDRHEPVVFGLTDVIPGWTEALQMMQEGSKWMIYVPYKLAYGDLDFNEIKPYSMLIFEIELLEIVKKDKKK